MTSAHSDESAVKPLRCPHCGGGLFIHTETVGPAYLTYETPESIECNQADCGAEWEPNGDVRCGPRWLEWPDEKGLDVLADDPVQFTFSEPRVIPPDPSDPTDLRVPPFERVSNIDFDGAWADSDVRCEQTAEQVPCPHVTIAMRFAPPGGVWACESCGQQFRPSEQSFLDAALLVEKCDTVEQAAFALRLVAREQS